MKWLFLLFFSPGLLSDVGKTVCSNGSTTFVREENDEWKISSNWKRVGASEGDRKNPSSIRMQEATKKIISSRSQSDAVEEKYSIDATVTYRSPHEDRRVETIELECRRYVRLGVDE